MVECSFTNKAAFTYLISIYCPSLIPSAHEVGIKYKNEKYCMIFNECLTILWTPGVNILQRSRHLKIVWKLKFNNENTRTMWEICLKVTLKTL